METDREEDKDERQRERQRQTETETGGGGGQKQRWKERERDGKRGLRVYVGCDADDADHRIFARALTIFAQPNKPRFRDQARPR